MELLHCTSSASHFRSAIYSDYDVFLNHRGPDVKQTLATSIYHHILRDSLNLRVFLDKEELQMGDVIPSSIKRAITTASVHITIFSINYADSPWCLNELCLILNTEAFVLPVFYNVTPSDLALISSGVYAAAFQRHEEKQRYKPGTLQEWKDGLIKASKIPGLEYSSQKGDHEEALLRRIVNIVLRRVTRREYLGIAKYPVGIDEAAEDFEKTIIHRSGEQADNVRMVAIVGSGGLGKSTLARTLYNRISPKYHRSCFLAEVRESEERNGLPSLQSLLLEHLSYHRHDTITNVSQGKEVMKKHLGQTKVLLVLDGIDSRHQLDALVVKNCLRPGSLVLVTSVDRGVLRQFGISDPNIYKMKELGAKRAQELFCMHAFEQPQPVKGFETLVQEFSAACGGSPLSLTVLGAQLRGNRETGHWQSVLEKIHKVMPDTINNSLKSSYDSLDAEQQDVFLDIACFFVGKHKSQAARIWEASGWSSLYALEALEQKCLIEYDDGDHIIMRSRVRDMGRHIAKSKLARPPRLWHRGNCKFEDSSFSELLRKASKQEGGTRIFYEQLPNSVDDITSSISLFLLVREDWIEGKSVELLWLSMCHYPFQSIPSFFPLQSLRVLDIIDGFKLETLWDDTSSQAPIELRELYISNSKLQKIPRSIGRLVHLERIILKSETAGSMIIKTLPEEFCDLLSLKHLELWGCAQLESLPIRFGDLANLQHLDLSLCSKLPMLPASFDKLIRLQYLCLRACYSLVITRKIFGNLSRLEHLDLSGCTSLHELPASLGNLRDLKELILNDCPNVRSLPESVGLLDCLNRLEISFSGVENLPKGVARMRDLEHLSILGCPIHEVKFSMSSDLRSSNQNHAAPLRSIVLSTTQTTFVSIAEEVFPNLESLIVENCEKLAQIEDLPTTLVRLEITNCKALKKITGLSHLVNLQKLDLSWCGDLEKLPSVARLRSLQYLKADGCHNVGRIEGLEELERLNERLQVIR